MRGSVEVTDSDVERSVGKLALSVDEDCVEEGSILEDVAVSLAEDWDEEAAVGESVLDEASASVEDDKTSALEVMLPLGEVVVISGEDNSVVEGAAFSVEED